MTKSKIRAYQKSGTWDLGPGKYTWDPRLCTWDPGPIGGTQDSGPIHGTQDLEPSTWDLGPYMWEP